AGVSILVPAGNGESLRLAISRGDSVATDQAMPIPFSPEISHWVECSLKRVSLLNELADMEASLPLVLSQLPDSLSVAMLSGGRFLGILNLTPKNPGRPISPAQVKAINILAASAAS